MGPLTRSLKDACRTEDSADDVRAVKTTRKLIATAFAALAMTVTGVALAPTASASRSDCPRDVRLVRQRHAALRRLGRRMLT